MKIVSRRREPGSREPEVRACPPEHQVGLALRVPGGEGCVEKLAG